MSKKEKRHVSPSRARYEEHNPVVSARVSKELWGQIQALRVRGISMGDIMRAGLGRMATSDQKLREAEKRGHQRGYEESRITARLAELADNIAGIQSHQTELDDIILDDPAKVLQIPMLRNDLDSLREDVAQVLQSVRRDVDRIYDLSKWLLGAMCLSVVGLTLSQLIRGKPEHA